MADFGVKEETCSCELLFHAPRCDQNLSIGRITCISGDGVAEAEEQGGYEHEERLTVGK